MIITTNPIADMFPEFTQPILAIVETYNDETENDAFVSLFTTASLTAKLNHLEKVVYIAMLAEAKCFYHDRSLSMHTAREATGLTPVYFNAQVIALENKGFVEFIYPAENQGKEVKGIRFIRQ